jgi:hypothetical protein
MGVMKILSIFKNLFKSKRSSDAELLRWAQTEYGKNWQAAYYQMKKNPGKIPSVRGVVL